MPGFLTFRLVLIGPAAIVAACATAPAAAADPGLAADICAMVALPETPGADSSGEDAQAARVNEIEMSTNWASVPIGYDGRRAYGPWGACPNSWGMPFEMLAFSPDRRLAMTIGSTGEGIPLGGATGYCLFEKVEGAWRNLACVITEIS